VSMRRDHWLRVIDGLDPETDYEQIYRITVSHEFPWDLTQALGFALYRTYAVPSIGGLLARTQEFTARTQKRYDDTALILNAILEHGHASDQGRTAFRRMNQMHRRYDISNDDMRYVLSTFVVVPKRWLDDYGWRRLSDKEIHASVRYYQTIAEHMGITDVPPNFVEFETLLDDYELRHFGTDSGGRAVSDATLNLLSGHCPKLLRRSMTTVSLSLMDDPLREAFGYPPPPRAVTAMVRKGLRWRGRAERLMPARRRPFHPRMSRLIKGYPNGYVLSELGTFPNQNQNQTRNQNRSQNQDWNGHSSPP
jgi:ER-bound oxygenase mpaB/B'/Rubber oxygenase, catalytic domain